MVQQPLADHADVEGLWRPLTDAEVTVVTNKIAVASALLRHHVPSVDERIEADTLSVDLVRGVIATAVIRSMQGDTEGLRSRTDTRGPFSETRVYRDAGDYSLFFTPAELGPLTSGARVAGVRVGSIRLASPWLPDRRHAQGWQSWTY